MRLSDDGLIVYEAQSSHPTKHQPRAFGMAGEVHDCTTMAPSR